MITPEWARLAQIYEADATAIGNEPLIVDLKVAGFSDANRYGIVLRVDGNVIIPSTGRPPDVRGVPPNSGLFICPEATPIETEADAIAGIFMDARPLAIPLNDPYLDVSNIGAGWGVQMTGTDLPIVVPKFHFLRMILVCQQESATPGPGAGSVGRLRAMVVIQDNVRC